jgi:hypothetical protein
MARPAACVFCAKPRFGAIAGVVARELEPLVLHPPEFHPEVLAAVRHKGGPSVWHPGRFFVISAL